MDKTSNSQTLNKSSNNESASKPKEEQNKSAKEKSIEEEIMEKEISAVEMIRLNEVFHYLCGVDKKDSIFEQKHTESDTKEKENATAIEDLSFSSKDLSRVLRDLGVKDPSRDEINLMVWVSF